MVIVIIYGHSYKWPKLNVFLRNSEELSAVFEACESIKHGDTLNTVHKKMNGFNVTDFRDQEKRQLIFKTPKHSADLCRVYLDEKGQNVKKVFFDVD
jgi:hypothetical protein